MTTPDTPLLVLHAMGDLEGGAPWRDAFERAGWSGPLIAPDLPGHGAANVPIGGNHELADPAFVVARLHVEPVPIVVGIGSSGWAAQLVALAGRCCGLVLIDGLGGPWLDPVDAVATTRSLVRAVADDPDAMAPPPAGAPDPRLRHGVPAHGSRRLAERSLASISVPVLVVETPSSPAPVDEVREVCAARPSVATVVALGDSEFASIAPAVVTWFVSTFGPVRASTEE